MATGYPLGQRVAYGLVGVVGAAVALATHVWVDLSSGSFLLFVLWGLHWAGGIVMSRDRHSPPEVDRLARVVMAVVFITLVAAGVGSVAFVSLAERPPDLLALGLRDSHSPERATLMWLSGLGMSLFMTGLLASTAGDERGVVDASGSAD